jgi:hypothetical protein
MNSLTDVSRKARAAENTIESVNAGSLQRIADATELMAKSYLELQAEAARYKEWYRIRGQEIQQLELRVAALKGVITKLKKGKNGN